MTTKTKKTDGKNERIGRMLLSAAECGASPKQLGALATMLMTPGLAAISGDRIRVTRPKSRV